MLNAQCLMKKAIKSLQPVDEENPKKPHKRKTLHWLILTGYAAQLGVTIYASARLGRYLDLTYQTDRAWTLICVLLGLFVSISICCNNSKSSTMTKPLLKLCGGLLIALSLAFLIQTTLMYDALWEQIQLWARV